MVRRSALVVPAVVALAFGAVVLTQRTARTSGSDAASARPADDAASPLAGPVAAGPGSRVGPAGTASGGGSAVVACPDLPSPGATSTSPLGSATHLFTRSTDDGVTVRVYASTSTPVAACGPVSSQGTATNPVECGSRSVSVEMSDDSAVGQGILGAPIDQGAADGSSTTSGETAPGTSEPQALSTGAFGVVEGDPVWWVALQVGSEVAQAKVNFADGSSDEMTPVDGIAVLVHHIGATTAANDPYTVKGTLTLTDPSGNTLATVTLPDVPSPAPVPEPDPSPPMSTPPGAATDSGASGAPSTGPASGGGSTSTNAGSSASSAVIACPVVLPPGAPLSSEAH